MLRLRRRHAYTPPPPLSRGCTADGLYLLAALKAGITYSDRLRRELAGLNGRIAAAAAGAQAAADKKSDPAQKKSVPEVPLDGGINSGATAAVDDSPVPAAAAAPLPESKAGFNRLLVAALARITDAIRVSVTDVHVRLESTDDETNDDGSDEEAAATDHPRSGSGSSSTSSSEASHRAVGRRSRHAPFSLGLTLERVEIVSLDARAQVVTGLRGSDRVTSGGGGVTIIPASFVRKQVAVEGVALYLDSHAGFRVAHGGEPFRREMRALTVPPRQWRPLIQRSVTFSPSAGGSGDQTGQIGQVGAGPLGPPQPLRPTRVPLLLPASPAWHPDGERAAPAGAPPVSATAAVPAPPLDASLAQACQVVHARAGPRQYVLPPAAAVVKLVVNDQSRPPPAELALLVRHSLAAARPGWLEELLTTVPDALPVAGSARASDKSTSQYSEFLVDPLLFFSRLWYEHHHTIGGGKAKEPAADAAGSRSAGGTVPGGGLLSSVTGAVGGTVRAASHAVMSRMPARLGGGSSAQAQTPAPTADGDHAGGIRRARSAQDLRAASAALPALPRDGPVVAWLRRTGVATHVVLDLARTFEREAANVRPFMLDASVALGALRLRLADVQYQDILFAVAQLGQHTSVGPSHGLNTDNLRAELALDRTEASDTNAALLRASAYRQLWKKQIRCARPPHTHTHTHTHTHHTTTTTTTTITTTHPPLTLRHRRQLTPPPPRTHPSMIAPCTLHAPQRPSRHERARPSLAVDAGGLLRCGRPAPLFAAQLRAEAEAQHAGEERAAQGVMRRMLRAVMGRSNEAEERAVRFTQLAKAAI
jgi:hypothetical protein